MYTKLERLHAKILFFPQVIKGLDFGIVGMCVGEKRRLTIPPGLAYGEQGAGDLIPGGATLVFNIELINIEEAAINPATSNIESNSGSRNQGSGGYGSGYTGATGGAFNQGFNPNNQGSFLGIHKPNSQSGLNNILPGGDLAQNVIDLIPGLGWGVTLTNGVMSAPS